MMWCRQAPNRAACRSAVRSRGSPHRTSEASAGTVDGIGGQSPAPRRRVSGRSSGGRLVELVMPLVVGAVAALLALPIVRLVATARRRGILGRRPRRRPAGWRPPPQPASHASGEAAPAGARPSVLRRLRVGRPLDDALRDPDHVPMATARSARRRAAAGADRAALSPPGPAGRSWSRGLHLLRSAGATDDRLASLERWLGRPPTRFEVLLLQPLWPVREALGRDRRAPAPEPESGRSVRWPEPDATGHAGGRLTAWRAGVAERCPSCTGARDRGATFCSRCGRRVR